jgi:Ca2+-binding EF-hand superfamily protein
MKTLIERYDENRDGQIQPPEAAAWLGRDAGTTAKSFAVRSTRAYRPVPRATSQVWQLIDGNNDGRLSREEIDGAPNRLLSLDADDDRVLAPTEMASLREQLESAGQQRRYVGREANHYAAMHLEPNSEIERLHYLLSDLYAPQQDLGPDSFFELPGLFKKLDASGDDWLDGEELASIRSVEPHLELDVAFREPANEKGGTAMIELKTLAPEVEVAAQPSADRTVISLGNTRLILSVHNLAAKPKEEQNSGQASMQNQIRLMVHDQADALFEELDANADGRLGEREIAFCSQRLSERDRNGDGQLAGDDFPYSMIVAFLLGEQANEQSFYVPPSPALSATSETALPHWFPHADLNADGDVSRREFLGSDVQFDRMDSDRDGYISAAESSALR